MMKSTILISFMLLVSYINCKESESTTYCEKSPCANNGVCNEFASKRECTCQLGYKGSDCLIDLCKSRPCFNGATCVQGRYTRYCVCPLGFSGEDCSVEECVSYPCRNGGTCIPKFMDRQCICPLGFAGSECETDICKTKPCLHDGQCIPRPSGASCVCQVGYTGRFCETAECDPNPCFNGRDCHAEFEDYHCHCVHEGGQRCQYNDIVPYGRPLHPKTYILPDNTKGFTYVPKMNIHASSTSYIYGMHVVTTGNTTPFYIQIWRQEGDQWRNLTLKYSKKISLSTNPPVQEIKFSDVGITCGAIRNWDRVGFFFPEGSNGIGLHDCKHNCEVFLNRDGMSGTSVGETLEFEWHDDFMHSFGVKVYFALDGEYGRKLDSNSCPENTELPDKTFGDRGDIVEKKEYSFSFPTAFNTEGGMKRNYTEKKDGISDSLLIGAVLGGLLFIAIIIIIVLAIMLCRRRPPPLPEKPKLPSRGIDNQMCSPTAGYTHPSDNSQTSDRSYLELANNNYYESAQYSQYMNDGH